MPEKTVDLNSMFVVQIRKEPSFQINLGPIWPLYIFQYKEEDEEI